MPTKREIFSQNVRNAIDHSHLTQVDISMKVGVSKGSVSDWYHGRTYPRPDKMEALAAVLGTTVYDLITDHENEIKKHNLPKNVEELAKELIENSDARALYSAITRLSEEDLKTVRHLVYSLSKTI